jgi:hypothetical protein
LTFRRHKKAAPCGDAFFKRKELPLIKAEYEKEKGLRISLASSTI